MTGVICIGRNIGDEPMDEALWREFIADICALAYGASGTDEWEIRWSRPDLPVRPLSWVQEGASEYCRVRGLLDPHIRPYSRVMQDRDRSSRLAAAYNSLPLIDPDHINSWLALAAEVEDQFALITGELGIAVEVVGDDPYASVQDIISDLAEKRVRVLATSVTGSHPVWTDEQNDKFRAVHDVFGHAATGRSFDRHGEEAAWRAHLQMFSPEARPAMTTETRGQTAALIWNRSFAPQKVAVLPDEFLTAPTASTEPPPLLGMGAGTGFWDEQVEDTFIVVVEHHELVRDGLRRLAAKYHQDAIALIVGPTQLVAV